MLKAIANSFPSVEIPTAKAKHSWEPIVKASSRP